MTNKEIVDAAYRDAHRHAEAKWAECLSVMDVIDEKLGKQIDDLKSVVTEALNKSSGQHYAALMRPCVYFLMKEGRVVYVGQSINFLNRSAGHRNKDFDDFRIISCDKEKLNKVEGLFIWLLKPPLNSRNQGQLYSVTELARALGLKADNDMTFWGEEFDLRDPY